MEAPWPIQFPQGQEAEALDDQTEACGTENGSGKKRASRGSTLSNLNLPRQHLVK